MIKNFVKDTIISEKVQQADFNSPSYINFTVNRLTRLPCIYL